MKNIKMSFLLTWNIYFLKFLYIHPRNNTLKIVTSHFLFIYYSKVKIDSPTYFIIFILEIKYRQCNLSFDAVENILSHTFTRYTTL